MGGPMGPMGMAPAMGMGDEGPPSKRQKTEDQLVPEADWLAQYGNKGPVMIRIEVPVVPEKPEWNLNGQELAFQFSLTDQVWFFSV